MDDSTTNIYIYQIALMMMMMMMMMMIPNSINTNNIMTNNDF